VLYHVILERIDADKCDKPFGFEFAQDLHERRLEVRNPWRMQMQNREPIDA
jgi:hypothetical protein